MKFTKMHGAGNDYVYVNGITEVPQNLADLSRAVSNRHFGIGADGLVIITASDTCDFGMRIFNADGSEAEMCGNASRCIGKYLYENKLTDKTTLSLETKAGTKTLNLHLLGDHVKSVTVDMGEPVLTPAALGIQSPKEKLVNEPLKVGCLEYSITCVSMGNPHAVIFVENLEDLDIETIGPEIESHPLFKYRTNTEFVEIISPQLIKMRVWERGSGETLACGTGACAALVASHLNGLCGRSASVMLPGGQLELEWREDDNRVYMTGPAVIVFEGEINL